MGGLYFLIGVFLGIALMSIVSVDSYEKGKEDALKEEAQNERG